MRIVIFNGPPRSGKSSGARVLARALQQQGFTVRNDSFAAPMKHYIAVLLGERYADMDKSVPRPELNGYTIREFLISESEDHMKPRYGIDVFARLLAKRLYDVIQTGVDWVVIDDCGFQPEVDTVVERLPMAHTTLIQVYRRGRTYDGDSRNYVTAPHMIRLHNDGTINEWHRLVKHAIMGLSTS